MTFRSKLAAVIHRSNIGLLSFRFFTPFHYGGRFYDAITAKSQKLYFRIIDHFLGTYLFSQNPNKLSLGSQKQLRSSHKLSRYSSNEARWMSQYNSLILCYQFVTYKLCSQTRKLHSQLNSRGCFSNSIIKESPNDSPTLLRFTDCVKLSKVR